MELSDAETLAMELMTKHGLIELGWKFQFDNAKVRFGYCRIYDKIISVSRHLTALNPVSEVHDMLLHEIAHALAPPYEQHGSQWQRIAQSIGASGTRCYSDAVVTPDREWTLTCPNCGHTLQRHRQRNRGRVACTACCNKHNNGRYDSRFNYVWTKNNTSIRFHSDG